MTSSADPIHITLEKWHRHLSGKLPGGLDEMLHDDVVFYSPVVFTPQVGKAVTMMYLQAAGGVFGGDEPAPGKDDTAGAGGAEPSMAELADSSFHYTKEIASGHHAVLEFETTMDGKHVNGIDMLTCDDDGKIVEFKVLIRPLQAVNAVHQSMMTMLEKMKG